MQADLDLATLAGLADGAFKDHAPENGHHFHASAREGMCRYCVTGGLLDVGLEYKGRASRAVPARDQPWRDNRRIALLRRSDLG